MDAPRCHDHKGRPEIPRACSTCQRISIEQDIATRTVDALLAAGYALQTDMMDDPRPAAPTRNRDEILAELMLVDEEFLGAFELGRKDRDKRPDGWVRFTYGNDGWDVMSDYTTNLESVLAPVNAYADSLI